MERDRHAGDGNDSAEDRTYDGQTNNNNLGYKIINKEAFTFFHPTGRQTCAGTIRARPHAWFVLIAHWFASDCGAPVGNSITDRPENCLNCHQHETLIRFDVRDSHPAVSKTQRKMEKLKKEVNYRTQRPKWKQRGNRNGWKENVRLHLGSSFRCVNRSVFSEWNCVIGDIIRNGTAQPCHSMQCISMNNRAGTSGHGTSSHAWTFLIDQCNWTSSFIAALRHFQNWNDTSAMKTYRLWVGPILIDRVSILEAQRRLRWRPWSVTENVERQWACCRLRKPAESKQFSVGTICVQLCFTVNGIMQ